MRDLLWFDPSAEALETPSDPTERARAAMRRPLPRRFWKEVTVGVEAEGEHRILLDGHPVKTPAKHDLALPTAALAEAVAAEWRAQATHLDPATMPVTRLANSVVDGVTERFDEVLEDALAYAGSDLLCYRAEGPERLVARQTDMWDPLLDWVEETHGARFLVAEGVVHVAQEAEAIATLRRLLRGFDPWRLAALHTVTTLTGSVVLALAVLEGQLDAEAAWAAAHLDEDWNAELWGRDAEAERRRAHRRAEYEAALRLAGL